MFVTLKDTLLMKQSSRQKRGKKEIEWKKEKIEEIQKKNISELPNLERRENNVSYFVFLLFQIIK